MTVTYEGDNSVLCQQAGNWLLRQYAAARAAQPVDSPLGTVGFLTRFDEILADRFRASSSDELKTTECELKDSSKIYRFLAVILADMFTCQR